MTNGVGIRAKEIKIIQLQHGGFELTTSRDSGFPAPPENAYIAGYSSKFDKGFSTRSAGSKSSLIAS